MTLFRPHRSLLSEAMAEIKQVDNRHDIEVLTGYKIVAVESYGYDERVGWNTYIVLTDDMPGYARQAIGFTNGPL